MGKTKQTRKFAVTKKMISPKDTRVASNLEQRKQKDEAKKKTAEPRHVEQAVSALFFEYNTQLGPPYHVLMDTNFFNFSIRKKLDIVRSMMDCLLAKCIPCITDCVMGELEKLGQKYKIALKLAKDPRFERIPCSNCKGCYADDCIFRMVQNWRCFIVATCDKELRGRIRKLPGVPCMYISGYRYTVERMPEAFGAPRQG
jgi:U3 small nucleolar RNA-associated protein 24